MLPDACFELALLIVYWRMKHKTLRQWELKPEWKEPELMLLSTPPPPREFNGSPQVNDALHVIHRAKLTSAKRKYEELVRREKLTSAGIENRTKDAGHNCTVPSTRPSTVSTLFIDPRETESRLWCDFWTQNKWAEINSRRHLDFLPNDYHYTNDN